MAKNGKKFRWETQCAINQTRVKIYVWVQLTFDKILQWFSRVSPTPPRRQSTDRARLTQNLLSNPPNYVRSRIEVFIHAMPESKHFYPFFFTRSMKSGMFSVLADAFEHSQHSFVPLHVTVHTAATAPATAEYTSTPLEAKCLHAAVEQFISCSACNKNIVSNAFANFDSVGRYLNQRPTCTKIFRVRQPRIRRRWFPTGVSMVRVCCQRRHLPQNSNNLFILHVFVLINSVPRQLGFAPMKHDNAQPG